MNGFGIARRVALVSLAVGAAAWVVVAGPLNPPAGAVSSTYKTLSEVEPRIAINATNTPGDATAAFVISQPGSYYLTGNINVSTALNGIKIAAKDVTIDLNGFELMGSTSALGAIVDLGSLSGISVRNGRLRGWSQGGVVLDSSRGCLIEDLTVIDVGGTYGVWVQFNSVIRNCTVDAPNPAVTIDIAAIGTQCCTVIQGCHVQGGDATSAGIFVNDGCTISDCVVNNCLSDGIVATSGYSTITNCTVAFNNGDGIRVGARCLVSGCTAANNSQGGIHVTNVDNRIEDNNITASARGLDVDVAGSVFLRNTASANTTNFDIVAGNFGVFVAGTAGGAVLGNSGGANIGGTDPNANYSY